MSRNSNIVDCGFRSVISSVCELCEWASAERRSGKRIGLVPTMGNLHDGHISLIRQASLECDSIIVSIFVNPMQFGKGEDYNSYPRTLNNDVQLIDGLGLECMYRVFVPEVSDMYPDGFNSVVKVGGVTESLEGKCRPTHFDGVTTVVLKLFNIARADAAYFGQKDYQQVCVVRKMTADLNLPIEIVTCPIVRDQSGLALSSRNAYLTDQQKKQATSIHQSLLLAENIIVNEKCRNVETITNAIKNKILNADNAEIDYIAVADPITLNELKSIENHKKIIILIAAKISNTRLIDNKIISIQ